MNSQRKIVTLVTLLTLLIHTGLGQKTYQRNKKRKGSTESRYGPFSNTQWWVGFRSGVTKAKGEGTKTFSNVSSLSSTTNSNEKKYEKFDRIGWLLGIEGTFEYSFLSVSLLPRIKNQKFDYSWSNSYQNATESYSLSYFQKTEIQSFSLPIQIRARILQRKRLKPSIFVGAYIDWVLSSTSTISTTENYTDFSGTSITEQPDFSLDTKDKFLTTNYGVYGGLGVTYDIQNIRIGMDASYLVGLSNVADENTRFNDNKLNTIDGVFDDFKLSGVQLELSIAIPIKFIFDRTMKRSN